MSSSLVGSLVDVLSSHHMYSNFIRDRRIKKMHLSIDGTHRGKSVDVTKVNEKLRSNLVAAVEEMHHDSPYRLPLIALCVNGFTAKEAASAFGSVLGRTTL